MTKELTSLKASKKSKDSEKRCLKDDAIDNCECKRLREEFVSLREEYQWQHGRAYDDYRARIERAIKSDPKTFFGYVDLKKKCVGYSSVMHFEGCLASGPEKICDLFAENIPWTYTDDVRVPYDPGSEHVPDDPLFAALFQDLLVNKGSDPEVYHRSF
jgi:hypothetical protein